MNKNLAITAAVGAGIVACKFAPRPMKTMILGNRSLFDASRETLNPQSPLFGKKIGFLGSSITYGAASHGSSFVEYLQARDGVISTKSAVSGTTLAGHESQTYVSRLIHDFDTNDHYDLFVCQLSTNDERFGKVMGAHTPASQTGNFDTNSTLGAIEFICQYIKENFHCPILFYTCVRKAGSSYGDLVANLDELQLKWHFDILNLWSNPVIKSLNKSTPYAMLDDAHPTKLGYQKIWTPLFEQAIENMIAHQKK